jgi:succinate-acetate transporter protein
VPVALFTLAVASLISAGQDLGWYATSDRPLVGWLLIAFPVPLLLICMAWAFAARSAVAGAISATLAGSWLMTGVIFVHTVPSASEPVPLAVAELGAGGALLLAAAVEGTLSSAAAGLAFTLAALRMLCIGIGGVSHAMWWQDAAGVAGLATVAVAAYTALGLLIEGTLHRDVLPLGRRVAVDVEPGVRPRL